MKIMNIKTLLALSICLVGTWSMAQAEIGMVTYAKGSVQSVLNGKTRALQRRSELFTGDEIKTGSGSSAKLRFSDSSVIDLKANSDFIIKKYIYSKAQGVATGGGNAFSAKLLTGSLSTVTGGIARVNRSGYRMEAGKKNQKPVAVIAVRGTRFNLIYRPTSGVINVKVYSGTITLNNVRLNVGDTATFNAGTNRMSIVKPNGNVVNVVPTGGLVETSETGQVALEDEANQEVEAVEKNDKDNNEGAEAGGAGGASGSPAGLDSNYILVDSGGFLIPVPIEDIFLFTGESASAFTSASIDAAMPAEHGDEAAP
jgi:hypothetical protein